MPVITRADSLTMGRRSLPRFFKMNLPCLAREFQGVINGAQSKSISFFVAQYCTVFQSNFTSFERPGHLSSMFEESEKNMGLAVSGSRSESICS